MQRVQPLRTVWAAAGPDATRGALVSSTLLLLERAGAVALALEIVRGASFAIAGLGAGLALLYGARALHQGTRRSVVQERLHTSTAVALLGGDVLRATPLDDEDAQGAVLDGAVTGSRFVSDVAPDMLADGLTVLVVGVWLAVAQPLHVVAAAAAALAAATVAAVLVRRIVRRAEERAWHLHGPVVDDLLAMLSSRLELVANGREKGYLGLVARHLAEWRNASLRADRWSMVIARVPALAAIGALAVVAGAQISWQRFLLGDVALQTALLVAGVPAFLGLAKAFHELVRLDTHVRAMAQILEVSRGVHGRAGQVLEGPLQQVELRGVTFAYGATSKAALVGASFVWLRGSPLVLTGPNGAGKSTALRLLLGLASPSEGSVLVDDVDLRTLDGAAWRRGVGYLAQRPFLSDRATVREAIRLLAPDAGDDAMRATLEQVDVWSALAASGGPPLDVRVGTLSVGQRQRVALARVLVKDAPILLLDEPDANLDAAGIRRVRALLEELAPHKMIAIVAHTDALTDFGGTVVRLPLAPATAAERPAVRASVPLEDART